MLPTGSSTGRPAPMAAATGSAISFTPLAPACVAASATALRSTSVIRVGTQMTTSGFICAQPPMTLRRK